MYVNMIMSLTKICFSPGSFHDILFTILSNFSSSDTATIKIIVYFFLIDLTLIHRTTMETSGQSCVYNNEAHNIKYFVNIRSRIIPL